MRMAWMYSPSAVRPADSATALPTRAEWMDLPSAVRPADAMLRLALMDLPSDGLSSAMRMAWMDFLSAVRHAS